jgi:hypothetical protein
VLLEVQGIRFDNDSGNGKGRSVRSLRYATKVHFNGNLMVDNLAAA